ncbi:MAG: hypothetical protein RLZ12_902 [Bacillota bacterium]|jgi:23S rRNA (guanosine2251-2'-O)-methyltransferase
MTINNRELLFGFRVVYEFLSNGISRLEKVWIGDLPKQQKNLLLDLAKKYQVTLQEVDQQFLNELGANSRKHGVVAKIKPYVYAELAMLLAHAQTKGKPPFLVMLDHLEDPQNLGSILRSANGAGVDGLIIPKKRASQITPVVHQVSAGATLYVPVARVSNLVQCIEYLKRESVWVIGLDQKGDCSYVDQDFDMPVAIVVGNEGAGLSRLVRERCDALISIPMAGKIASLNAAVATAIIMYRVHSCRIKGQL